MSNTAKRRFLALTVDEVSTVGEPANEVEWLVTKNKQEAAMAGEVEEAEKVVVKSAATADGPTTVDVLKAVNGIVDSIFNIAKAGGSKAPKPTEEEAADDVSKGMTLKGFMKKSGMSEEMMSKSIAELEKAGFDPDMAFAKKPAKPAAPGEQAPKGKSPPGEVKPTPTKKDMGDEPLTTNSFLDMVQKAKAMTPGRIDKLKTAKAVLDELLGDVDPASDRVPANLPKGTSPDSGIKALTQGTDGVDGSSSTVSKSLSQDELNVAVAKAMEPLATQLAAVTKELDAVKKARPTSNSSEGEGGTEAGTVKVAKSIWSGLF